MIERRNKQIEKLALSAFAASIAETATFPVDMIKTRMQLSTTPATFTSTALNTVRAQGIPSLYSGLAAAVIRHIPYTSIRIFTFETLRNKYTSSPTNTKPSLLVNLAIGMTAGALGQAAAVPADLVKIRLQADGRSGSARYKGFIHACTTITREEGFRGLYRGSLPAIQRAALVNLGELSTYDAAKRAVISSGVTGGKDKLQTHVLASMCSGFVASLVSTPADVVKSRLMNQSPTGPRYRGMADCFIQTWSTEGLRGLYKGFLPTWSRLGPWQMTFWISFEQARKLAGLEPF